MPSVFLSYDHGDAARAALIATALEANGHAVWWDRHLPAGAEYNSEIESAVRNSEAVVVLWSERSVRSAWVRDEAAEGRDAGKLVPVLIEQVKPPMGFRQFQALDFSDWKGGKRIARLSSLLAAIDRVAGIGRAALPEPPPPPPLTRAATVAEQPRRPLVSRRALVAGAAATALAATGTGLWWSTRNQKDPRVIALLGDATTALNQGAADNQTEALLQQAVAIAPDNASAWGLLALTRSLLSQRGSAAVGKVSQAESAARRGFAIDPKEPNALLAMFELQGSSLDWISRDEKLRQILSLAPDNVIAVAELVLLTQATGMNRESWGLNERALSLEPLNPDYLSKRALKLFILGRTGEADKVIDQARSLHPEYYFAWWVRFYIYAFSDRTAAAQAMLASNPTMSGKPALASLWRDCLPLLGAPSADSIVRARKVCIPAARASPLLASQAVLTTSALGDVDTAFDIANGYLLSEGPVIQKQQDAVQDAGWRISTQWMWTPPAAPMRQDPRFMKLCAGIGLTEYWRRRGVRPDYKRA